MKQSQYNTLGVSISPTTSEIKKAYKMRKLDECNAKKITASNQYRHYEAACNVLQHSKFRAAYQRRIKDLILKDKESKAKKDSRVHSRAKTGAQNVSNFKPRKTPSKPCVKDPNTDYDVFLTLEEIDKGCVKRATINRLVNQNDKIRMIAKVVKIMIPPGCPADSTITFKNLGDQLKGDAPADVVFTVREKMHPIFERVGNDLVYKAIVSKHQLKYRTQINVPTLDGGTVWINTDGNLNLRLTSYGLTAYKNVGYRGDMIIMIQSH